MNPYRSGSAIGDDNISGYRLNRLSNLTPQQEQLFNLLLGGSSSGTGEGLDYLSRLASGDPSSFEQMERPAYDAFDKLLGEIGSRYAQAGAIGSSSYQNALAGAGGDLAKQLQAQRSNIQMSALDRLLGQSNSLLNQRLFENILNQKPQSQSRGLIGQILGTALPSLLGGFSGGFGRQAAGQLFGSGGMQ